MTSSPSRPDFGLIIVGDEILSGKRADKHLPKFIELLHERGLSLAWAEYVGDSPERITQTLKRAFASSDVVFSTGGIGATPDDHTRQCAGRALGRELSLHPQAEAFIRERIKDTAKEQGTVYDPDRPDNIHRLNMGVFPMGATIIPNPYNKIAGFSCVAQGGGTVAASGRPKQGTAPLGGSDSHEVQERGGTVHFVPGFPVMAWPMMAWVLDTHYAAHFNREAWVEQSVVVFGAMEAALTPLMESLEQEHPGIKVFSLPSVDHPVHGRHIELGVKGAPEAVAPAYAAMLKGLEGFNAKLGPEMVRK